MTLIIGLNLSDRLYLASDTRVTDTNSGSYEDNGIKITVLKKTPEQIIVPDRDDGDHIAVAAAGYLKLAAFIFEHIQIDIYEGRLDFNIRDLYQQLNREYFDLLRQEWMRLNGRSDVRCSLIFAGNNQALRKEISIERARRLSDILELSMEQRAAGMDESNIPFEDRMIMWPEHFNDAIASGGNLLTEYPDSLVFVKDFSIQPGGINFRFDENKAEWGEYLARGYEYTEHDLPDDILARLEFLYNRNAYRQPQIIADIINMMAQRAGEPVIGGAILIHEIRKDKWLPLRNAEFSRYDEFGSPELKSEDGSWKRGYNFTVYHLRGGRGEQAELIL